MTDVRADEIEPVDQPTNRGKSQIADRYEISHDPARLDITRIHQWLSTDSYWAMGRNRETVERTIAGSLCFGAYDGGGNQVAFARVVTDLATFGWLSDVYVDPTHRGTGIGTRLVTTVRDHLAPYRLKRLLLTTADAHGLYAKIGFAPVEPGRFMSIALDN